MSDRQYEKLIVDIIKYYDIIELEIMTTIARHLLVDEDMKPTTEWLIKKLEELGGINADNIKIIAKYSKMTNREIQVILEEVIDKAIPIGELNQLYKTNQITIDPKAFMESNIIKNIYTLTYNEVKDTFVEVNRAILESANEKYIEILNQAYLEVSSGVYDYQTSIRKAINNFGDAGISGATYRYVDEETGRILTRRYDIAGVVRRDILTTSHQLAVKSNMAVIDELKPEYVRLSEHIKCRIPHFHWQGTIIKREDLYEITKVGEVDGLGGINCKHEVYAYFGDARGNDLKTIGKDDSSKEYELSQRQRQMERYVRKYKRKEVLFENNKDNEYYEKSKKKRIYWQRQLKTFTEQNDLIREYIREKI